MAGVFEIEIPECADDELQSDEEGAPLDISGDVAEIEVS